MTNTVHPEADAICAHNFIFITRSSYGKVPYYFCSRCGEKRDHLTKDEQPAAAVDAVGE